MENTNNTLKLLNIHLFLSKLLIHLPIMTVFIKDSNLSFLDISILLVLANLSKLLLEIPAGYLADTKGRLFSMKLSNIITAIAFSIIGLSSSFTSFAIGLILLGIGYTLLSGIDSSFIYEYLKKNNELYLYNQNQAKRTAISFSAIAIASLISSIIAHNTELYTCFLLSSFFNIIALIPISKIKVNELCKHNNIQITTGLKSVFKNPSLLKLMLIYSFFIFGIRTFFDYQPFFLLTYIEKENLGFLYILFTFSSAIGGLLGSRLLNKHQLKDIFKKIIYSPILLILIPFSPNLASLILLISIISLAFGLFNAVAISFFNQYIKESHLRSTIISIFFFAATLTSLILHPLTGIIADSFSKNYVPFTLSIISCFIILISWKSFDNN